MGRRGPRPTPTRLRVLKGETKPSRVNYREPRMMVADPVPPPGLSEKARPLWDAVVHHLRPTRMLTEVDAYVLGVFCEHWVNHEEMQALVRSSSYLVRSRKTGDLVKNPLVGMVLREAHVVRVLAQEYGLTPSARSSIISTATDDADLEQLLS